MTKICYFYAVKEDILRVTEQFEAVAPVSYVRFGHTTELPPESFARAAQIPNLGMASNASAVGCEKFLVCDSQTTVEPRPLKMLTEETVNRSDIPNRTVLKALIGAHRYTIDQLINPDTICFSPGGLWQGNVLLHGGVSTATQSELSQALMKRFTGAIRKSFVKVEAFYVGPQALALLKNGARLTIAVQSPLEYDLKLNGA